MANAIIAVAGKITDFIVVPVLKKYLRPIFYFKTVVDDFQDQNRRLTAIQERVETEVQRARDNAQVIYDGVEEWMIKVNTSMQEVRRVENGLGENKRCFRYSWCPHWTCHYSFSKKVSKITVTMKTLSEEGNSFSSISHPPTLHQGIIGSSSCTAFMHSQSSKSAFVEIMEALKSDDVKVIGLHGEAGMGKTMLAIQVAEEAQKHPEHFKLVVMVNVSIDQPVKKIQGIIADYLQLRLEQESVDGRASKLKLRLESGEKILLILDGVWKELDVGAIGIHSSNSGCKVLYTAHSRSHVPDGLQTQSYVQLAFLPEDEAWDRVQSIAGIGDQVREHDGAKTAIAESKGHPKFVMTLGTALTGKGLSEWDEALELLRVSKHKVTEDLEEQAKKLSLRSERVKNEIKIAKDNVEEISEDVDNWLIDVEKAMKDKEQFMNEFNKTKYFFDEHGDVAKVKELTVSVKKVCTEGNFVKVSYASPLHQVLGSSSSSADFMPSQSAISAFSKILEALQTNDANIIGLYGMGGIGKTTLAVQVQKEVGRTKIFDHTIMVTISQRPEVRSIQGTIADFLNLKLEQETEEGRARKLNKRLKDEKVFIILDDLWKQFDLRSIGIVLDECKGCKILLTTRRKEVCNSMDCLPKIELNLFAEDESQEFFKKKAGLSNLDDVAKQIVGECKCLPIALATVGAALKNKGRDEWIEALENLKNARLPDIIGVDDDEKNVYKCLLFSYEYLKRSTQASQAPFMLLLCSLFPEDYDIAVEDLTRYAFGMNLFERVGSIEDARRKVRVTIRFLKDSCLLLGTNEDTFVKMHDMVRDAMLWTGGKEVQERNVLTVRDDKDLKDLIKKKSFQDCRAVSFMPDVIPNLSKCNELEFPNLEIVLIFIKERENLDADREGFFQHMQVLKVLDINGLGIWNTFAMPQSHDCLKDLRTLLSRWCRFSNSSILGKLEKLEVLSLYNCEIDCGVDLVSGLKELRLLDSTGLKAEKRFTSNGIGKLVNLEELHGHVFTECNLCELKLLTNLVALYVKIEDAWCIPTGFCFPSLESYDICIGADMHRSTQWLESLGLCRILQLIGNIGDGSSMINTCKKLLPSVQVLYFEGCEDLRSLSAFNSHTEGLERLEVKKCKKMKWVFEFELTSLKILKLEELHKLEQVWKGVIRPVSLCNLVEIHIVKCSKLIRVFSSSLVACLEQLEILKISHCSKLEEIISSRGGSDDDGFSCCCCFTNLRELEVSGCQKLRTIFPIVKSTRRASRLHPHPQSRCRLPELQSIVLTHNSQLEHIFNHQSQAEEGVECPSLLVLNVTQSPKISTTHFVATQLQVPSPELLQDNSMDYIQGVEEPLQSTIICFSYLQRVELIGCEKLKQVFAISLVTSLQQLEVLIIRGCHELEQVISVVDDGKEEPTIGIYFENLKTLEVCSCGKLKAIFPIPITLPKLEKFQLHNNAELENLFGPSDEDCTWQCLILEDLSVQDCPKMSRQFGAYIQNMSKAKAKHVKLGEIKGMEEVMQIETLTCHLYTLSLRNLEDLKCIWHGPTQNICFANLGLLDVHGCNGLKHVLETSIVAALPRLSTLSVKRCNELEQVIVMAKDGNELSVGVVFEKLRFLEVSECGKLKTIFPLSIALPRLESLRLESNAELEHVFGRSDLDCSRQYPFMKNLCLKDCPKLCTVQHPSPSKLVGENLYRLVEQLEHENAEKVTGILLEIDETQVLHLIQSPQALKAKVAEANEILRTFAAQQAYSPTDAGRHPIDNNSDNDTEEEAFSIWV